MSTGRLEAFSDGVLAIIVTIMVLELRQPEGDTFASFFQASGPGLMTYLLSFVYVAIYWNNHHHTFQLTDHIDGTVLWANLTLLFVLSLLPFTTGWMDETHFARAPLILYGTNLLLAAMAFIALQWRIIRAQGEHSPLRRALGSDWKGKASVALYATGIAAAAIDAGPGGRSIALTTFVGVAVMWFIPDQRIDRAYRGTGD